MTPRRTPRREVQPHLVPLAAELRRAREALRPQVSGSELARRMQWGQTKVSLIEGARQTPTASDIETWAAATGVEAGPLLEMREGALNRVLDIRAAARFPGGANALQSDLAQLEAASSVIAEYQPDMIPGLAQTPAYTRVWLEQRDRVELGDPVDVDDVIARREVRKQQARGRRVVVAVQPAALTSVYGPVPVQVEQLEALTARASASEVELIVAQGAVALLHGFELLDDVAIIETVIGAQVLGIPEDVAQFRAAFARIRRTGLTGRAAIREVERARDQLR